MALKKGHEIATIDVCLVTVTTSETTPREIGLTTATQIQVDPQIETTEAIKLIIFRKSNNACGQRFQSRTCSNNTGWHNYNRCRR